MTSLAEEIAKLADPTPHIDDPEDDIDSETVAKLSSKFDDGNVDVQVSALRNRNAPLLDEIDERYAGKRISRKLLDDPHVHDSSELDSESESDSHDNENYESTFLEENIELFRQKMETAEKNRSFISEEGVATSEGGVMDMDEEEGDEDEEEDEEEEDEEDYDEDDQGSAEDMVEKFSNIDMTEEIEKGKAIQKQQELWNKLCECRIKLQKLLLVANKFPQYDKWADFKQKCNKPYAENLRESNKSVGKLLKGFCKLQSELIRDNIEMSVNENVEAVEPEEDEEVLSTSEEEETREPVQQNLIESKPWKRKRGLEDYGEFLAKRYKSLIPYRNSVIQKWDEKTRLSSGQMAQKGFIAFEQSVLKQIDQILQDKSRLIRKTQLKRSKYHTVGKLDDVDERNIEANDIKVKQDDVQNHYDPEIFDDDDFYRQLLKDVIESKSVLIDPLELSKQLEIQRIRSKLKRKADTKASKGRKIRFDVHAKLLNHKASVIQPYLMSHEARDDLYSSFGEKL